MTISTLTGSADTMPSASPRRDRRRAYWIAGCLAMGMAVTTCLCCLTGLLVAVWLWKQDQVYPTEPEPLTQVVQLEVTRLRGLEFRQPVVVRTLTPDELRQRMAQKLEEEFSPQEARNDALVLAAFDLLDPDTDLYSLYVDLYSELVAGFYEPETKELYVVSDSSQIGVLGRLTLAHELTHALQDQYYDLQAMGYGRQVASQYDSEYLVGVMGLVEGDASLVQAQYMRTLSPLDWARLAWEYSRMDWGKYSKIPAPIYAGFTFPYNYGPAFVADLYRSGGWAGVNSAFAHPPQSTEQILHPDRYRAGDAPRLVTVPPLTDTLGSGWHLVDEEVMGEFAIRLHLSPQLGEAAAALAAEGWGGDRYAVYYHETRSAILLLWRTVWDTQAEAHEFVERYTRYLDRVARHSAGVTEAGRSCWTVSTHYRCLVWDGEWVTVVRGPDQATVEQVLRLTGSR